MTWDCAVGATDERLDAFLKLAAREQNAMLARLAHDANVRAESNHLPFKSAAWMRLAQTHNVAEPNVEGHGGHYKAIGQLVN